MNVTVENLTPCKKLVRFEVEAAKVDEAFAAVTKTFVREASLPGFRPGKAPKERVAKQYEAEIAKEAKTKLISDAYREGVKLQNLNVLGYPDIEEIQFEAGKPLQFAATVETQPEFELPEYRGLPAKREASVVSEDDITRALDALRGQQASFTNVDRAVQSGDYVVVNYTGTCDGQPITDLAPTARGLTKQDKFWVEVKPGSFIPGFADQLIGAKPTDKRTVNVDFPADFVTPQLSGKKGVYEVEVLEVKIKVLPELNEALAKTYGAESLERLREGVRSDLQNELNLKTKRSIRNQVVDALAGRVQFDLPESIVAEEARNIVYNIVNENHQRGIPKEVIDQQKDQIYAAAQTAAQQRVKSNFLFVRIAEKEGIRATQEEINGRVISLARGYKMTPEAFVKELQKRDGVHEIYQQLIHEKVLDFLHEQARIEDVAPAAKA